MKLLAISQKTKGIRFVTENGKEEWGSCIGDYSKKTSGDDVLKFVSNNFKAGDEARVDYIVKNGHIQIKGVYKLEGKVETSPVEPKKTVEAPKPTPVTVPPVVKSEPKYTGVGPKVSDYASGLVYPDRYMSPRTPEESKQIRSLALIGSTAEIVNGMLISQQCVIDANSLPSVVESWINTIYNILDKKAV